MRHNLFYPLHLILENFDRYYKYIERERNISLKFYRIFELKVAEEKSTSSLFYLFFFYAIKISLNKNEIFKMIELFHTLYSGCINSFLYQRQLNNQTQFSKRNTI